jgi:ribosomal protein S18 acetylase RimI-like enzyme
MAALVDTRLITAKMTITYRPLTPADHEFCVRVHHLAMRAYVEPLWGWNEALQSQRALESLARPDAVHEIALLNEMPLGYLSYEDRPESLFLDELYLHPDHQAQGHGGEIMSRLIAMAHSRRKPIELSVLTTNPRARRFYERHGFMVLKTTTDRIRMRRATDGPRAK